MSTKNSIRVLLASPSDLSEERDVADRVARELNETLLPAKAAHIEILKWEIHTVPDIGTDAQDSVNRQLGEDFDVFIGMLWTRFGTPTPRARSGTEEEFKRALNRKRKHPEIRVLFYFKISDVPYSVDVAQLKLVREFKASIKDEGLIREFDSVDDFEKNLRMALTRFALQVDGTLEASAEEERETSNDQEVDMRGKKGNDDEVGLYDLNDQAEESLKSITALGRDIESGILELNKWAGEATQAIKRRNESADPDVRRDSQRTVNSFGNFMSALAIRMEGHVPPFRQHSENLFSAIQGMARIAPDFGPSAREPLESNRKLVTDLGESVQDAEAAISRLLETIEDQPRLTTSFNKGRRELVSAMRKLSEEMVVATGLAKEAGMLVDDMLSRI